MKKVVIYTDGGCSPNPGLGGWGAVLMLPESGKIKELFGAEDQSTNNRMELTVAIEALNALKFPCKVDLHTDSKYLQNAFTQKWIDKWQQNGWRRANKKSVINQDLWERLLDLAETHSINWCWVKGHSSNKYNERCDALVHRARKRFKSTNR